MIDLRTILAVVLTLFLASAGLGRDLPINASGIVPLATSLSFFIGYLYLVRTLVRLPFAAVIAVRSMRYARLKHGLDWRDSLRDGFMRGFMDTRRWTVDPLASIDRLAVVGLTLLTTIPYLGLFLIRFGGLVGITLLLILYLFRGTFGFLVEDSIGKESSGRSFSLPFLDRGGK